MAEHRVGELAGRGERLVAVAELLAEEMVDRGEHLGSRAVVARERQALRRCLAALAEDRDVRVAEAVDRLELVADEERRRGCAPVPPRRAGRSISHWRRFVSWNSSTMIARKRSCSVSRTSGRRAGGRARAAAGLRSRAPTRAASRLRTRRRRDRAAPAAARCRAPRARRARPARGARAPRELGGAVAARAASRGRAAARGSAPSASAAFAAASWFSVAPGSAASSARPPCSSASRSATPACSPSSSFSSRPGRAQRLVDAVSIRRSPLAPYVASSRSRSDRAPAQNAASARSNASPRMHGAVLVVELAEAGIDADRERMRAQQPRAEAVDRRDPRAVEPPREVVAPARVQRGADARAQLARRLARVGDDEHRLDVEPSSQTARTKRSTSTGRLPGAGARRDEHLAGRFDRRASAARSRRAPPGTSSRGRTRWGTSPPFGSCWTSPARMRVA